MTWSIVARDPSSSAFAIARLRLLQEGVASCRRFLR